MRQIPFIGNVVTDPQQDFKGNTASGVERLPFRLAVNSGERGTESEKSDFFSFTAFGSTAVNMKDSIKKGDRVIVIARLETYNKEVQIEGKDVNLTMPSFKAQNVAPDLTWATAVPTKNPKKGGSRPAEDNFSDEAPKAAAKTAPAKAAPAKAAAPDDDF